MSTIRGRIVRSPTAPIKLVARFPSRVIGINGFKVTKSDGVYIFQPDFGSLSATLTIPPTERATRFLQLHNSADTPSYEKLSLQVLLDMTSFGLDPNGNLAALSGTSGTGLWAVTGVGTGSPRTITAPVAGITVANGDGVAGNPTLALANDLAALEGLASTGIAVRTASDAWAQRTITGTANEITVTNGDGVSGNPTASLPSALTFAGKTVTGGTFASPAAITGLPSPTNSGDAATKGYVDGIVAAQDAMVFKGVIDCSTNPNYPAADRGHTYRVSVAGKIGGASGANVEAGDLLLCLTDGTSAGTQAAVGANWAIAQTNLDGAVIGPASATSDNFSTYNGTTGKLIKDSGKAAPSGAVVGTTDTQTLTNKTISGASNTLTVREADLSTTDVTTGNVSTTKHGFAPKLPNDATKYLDGTGSYSTPAGGGGGGATELFTAINLSTAGTIITDATSQSSAAIDGTTNQAASACATKTSTQTMYLGLSFSTPRKIFRARIAGSNDQGYVNSSVININIKLFGKQGSAPANGTDGTPLHSLGFYDTANESTPRELISWDRDTEWDHVWLYIEQQVGTNASMYIGEIELYEAVPYVNLNPTPGPNIFLNGAFQFWPRGTSFSSFSTGDGVYTAARWVVSRSDSAGNLTVSMVDGPQGTGSRAIKLQRTAGATNTIHVGAMNTIYRMPTPDVVALRGRVVTISIQGKVGANFSGNPDLLSISVYASADTADLVDRGDGGALVDNPYYFFNSEVINPTTSWQRATLTFTVPNDVSSLDFRTRYYPDGTAGADDSVTWGEAKLEVGYFATPFVTPDEATNRFACETFFRSTYADDTAPGLDTVTGLVTDVDMATSTTGTRGSFHVFPNTMRASATITLYPRDGASVGNLQYNSYSTGVNEITPTFLTTNHRKGFGTFLSGASGLTSGAAVIKFYHYTADAEIYGT